MEAAVDPVDPLEQDTFEFDITPSPIPHAEPIHLHSLLDVQGLDSSGTVDPSYPYPSKELNLHISGSDMPNSRVPEYPEPVIDFLRPQSPQYPSPLNGIVCSEEALPGSINEAPVSFGARPISERPCDANNSPVDGNSLASLAFNPQDIEGLVQETRVTVLCAPSISTPLSVDRSEFLSLRTQHC